MRILESIQNDVAVLKVAGKMMSPPQVVEFHDHVRRLVNDHQIVHVVADFSNVVWFGSAMLGVLTASLQTLRCAGGDLCLTGLNRKTERALIVTRLIDAFFIAETIDHAVVRYQISSDSLFFKKTPEILLRFLAFFCVKHIEIKNLRFIFKVTKGYTR